VSLVDPGMHGCFSAAIPKVQGHCLLSCFVKAWMWIGRPRCTFGADFVGFPARYALIVKSRLTGVG